MKKTAKVAALGLAAGGLATALGLAAGLLLPARPALAAEPTSAAKVRVLVHSWGTWESNPGTYDPKSVSPIAFKVRRANTWITGQPDEHWGYNVLIDPALLLAPATVSSGSVTSAYAILKDAYVTYDRDWFKLQIGQQKVPISDEFMRSTVTLDTIERSAFATKAISGDFGFMRDIGALATLDADFGKLQGGIFNGSGENLAANAEPKSFIGRAELTPLGDMVKVGGAYLYGFKKSTAAAGTTTESTHSRAGGDARLKLGPVRLDAEALMAQRLLNTASPSTGLGYYGQAMYSINSEHDVLVKAEAYNEDLSLTDKKSKQRYSVGGGWNWKLRGQGTRVQLNYFHDFLPGDKTDDRVLTNFAVYL